MAKKGGPPDWVTEPPKLTIVSDAALISDDPDADTFDLARQVGPLFDILRHSKTKTPFAAAIYGDWGTGKTSAMRWLEGRLAQWNGSAKNLLKEDKNQDVRIVRTAWFYPWKYQERDDVWRGLVAEVILACLKDEDYDLEAFTRDAKDLGRFLGRSFINVLASVKFDVGGVGVNSAALKKIADDFADTATPESAYLNEFETVMGAWVQRSLKKSERLVVFIDDLDRCMPDIALQVLEALKLYLNIEQLIFVVGVDKTVVDQLVVKRYDEMGVKEEKALDYLAKMFQVEIPLAPTEWEVEEFFAGIVAGNETWERLDHREDALRPVIINLAKRSPREVKRLVNSALIHALGVGRSKLVTSEGIKPPTGAQSVQVFLLRRILGERYTMATLAGSKAGAAFFMAWSDAVAEDQTVPNVRLTESEIESLGRAGGDVKARLEPSVGARGDVSDQDYAKIFKRVPGHLRDVVTNPAFHAYLGLLRDEDLGALMRIPYHEEAAVLGNLGGADESEVIREAVARSLGKPVEDVTPEDFASLSEITLANTDIEDLAPIATLTRLQDLDLDGTQVQDLTPLAALTSLQELTLRGTQVQDLGPLAALTSLQNIGLEGTQVQDLGPLAALTSLQRLDLQGTQVQDLAPLAALTSLRTLYLGGTQVQDLGPLAALTSLQRLDLQGTQVQDLGPLAALTSLQQLFLSETQVQDLGPLVALTSLEFLDLQGTQVQDLGPLAALTSLTHVDLRECPVSPGAIDALRESFPNAAILTGEDEPDEGP